jgi:hypothetical protein
VPFRAIVAISPGTAEYQDGLQGHGAQSVGRGVVEVTTLLKRLWHVGDVVVEAAPGAAKAASLLRQRQGLAQTLILDGQRGTINRELQRGTINRELQRGHDES